MVSALTDARGEFVLDDVPVGKAIPIVIEIGRWRRIAAVDVEPCVETRAADDAVRLPRRAAEGDLPRIAVTSGASDALECLLRSIGNWLVATGASASPGTIHLDDVTSSLGQARTPPAQVWIRKNGGAARYFSFNTPVGAGRADQCGRVVFGDLHGFGLGGSDYPAGCPADPKALSPQQLALEFLLFDLFACVDDDRERPVPPR